MIARSRPVDGVAWSVVGGALALVALTLLAGALAPSAIGSPGGPAALPRVPAPATGGGGLIRVLGVGSVTWYAGLVSAPVFLAVSRATARRGWGSAAAATALLALVVAFALGATALQYRLTFGAAPLTPGLGPWLRAGWPTAVLPFLAVAAAVRAVDLGSRLREREVRTARAEARAAEARLAAISARLQPHFLFNTLQGISTLIRRDPEAADAMLGHLADLLREVLRRRDRPWVSVDEELEVLAPYLAIAHARYGARLDLHVDVAPEARQRIVPFFVLQPLLENALEHGVARRAGPVRVDVTASVDGDRLILTVADDGPGEGAPGGSGTGLHDLGTRLDELYGPAARLDAGPELDGGWTTRVALPSLAPTP